MLYLDTENLILNPSALRAQKNARLTQLKTFFRRYYGFINSRDIATALSLQQAIGQADRRPPPPPGGRSRTTPDTTSTRNGRTPTNAADVQAAIGDLNVRADPALVPIFEILMEGDSTVAKTILTNDKEAIRKSLNDLVTKTPTADQQRQIANISRCIKIHYCEAAQDNSVLEQNQICLKDLDFAVPILDTENVSQEFVSDIKRRIAVVRMDHPLLMPGEKNAELLSVFFNGIPTLELTRATPVLNVKFFSTRQTLVDNKLSAITLQKFVEGARDIGEQTQSNVALHAFAKSNQIPTGSVNGNRTSVVDFNTYTVTGLELFRMPQSLQNIEGYKQVNNYLAPIIDPFRPLASIKSFSVDVKSAYGLQGTRTATLEIVLHDRSRMSEFADFVKPDRFGETFLEVEYGWLHPDLARDQNPYADLLNLTRSVEHFTIVTSNFNFDEVGQVYITLNLIGRGTAESTELSIVGETAASRIQTQIRQIERLSETINRLSGIVFPNQAQSSDSSTHRREIRGIQGLSAAGDATNNLILSRDVIRELSRLSATLDERAKTDALRPAAEQLKTAIQNLVGSVNENSTAPGERSRLTAVSQTLNLEIRTILNSLNNGPDKTNKDRFYNDSFLRTMPVWNNIKDSLARDRPQPTQNREATPRQQLPSTGNNSASALPAGQRLPPFSGAKVVSLGTLLTAFVAKPLAALKNSDNTPKFKEVQMYFYNFNNKASWMSYCNISQFPVQTDYFTREYGRMRMESVSRTVNLSVNEFLSFVASRIVDDVINPAYGISDLYKINEEQQVEAKNERSFERDMEKRMRRQNIGEHPDFVPPQVTFEIEATPSTEADATTGNSQTVLKIHVFDKACSPNNPYRELLNLATENVLGTLSAYPGDPAQRTANEDLAVQNANARTEEQRTNVRNELRQNWRQLHNAVVEDVRRLGLIAPINSAEGQQSEASGQYRFSGGPQQLKEYIMKGMPHIIYGAMATTIKTATLGSQSDPALNTINIQRSLNASPVQPNGQQPGGVPLSVYPVELNMTSLGCPILRYGQEIFVDYNTNTSIDNMYYITGLQHKIEAGSFETTIKFTAVDAFGRYRNLISQLDTAAQTIAAIPQGQPQAPATPTQQRHHRSHTPRR
jgi:hypothetical protein